MKIIIHDLNLEQHELLKNKCDKIIHANGDYASCQGCFSCWTKSPAKCFIKDKLADISRVIGKADELIIITKNCFGTYSPSIKTILDRSIGLSTPLSRYRNGEMHHCLRYGKHELLNVYVYGNFLKNEKNTFELVVTRNAINYGFRHSRVLFIQDTLSLKGII